MDMKDEKKSVKIFCCYAREDQPLLLNLQKHLMPIQREGLITLRSDMDINVGMEWEKELHRHLNAAQIILLLISPDFMASEYCYSIEMQRAMERHEREEVCVIPIILRPCVWEDAPFGKLQALPTNAVPIDGSGWQSQDEAFADVTKSLQRVIDILASRSAIKQKEVGEDVKRVASGQEEREFPQRLQRRTMGRIIRFSLVVLVCLLGLGVGLFQAQVISWPRAGGQISTPTPKRVAVLTATIPPTPMPSPTPTLFPTPTPQPSPPSAPSLIPSGWRNVLNTPSLDAQWVNNSDNGCPVPGSNPYKMQALGLNYCNYEQISTPPWLPASDLAFSVDVSINSGNWAGIAIRLSGHSYYYLEVNPNNSMYKFEYHDASNGGNDIYLTGNTGVFSGAIQQGTGTNAPRNTLLVVAQKTSFHIYLNDQLVRVVTDSIFQGSGNIGLVAGSGGSDSCTALFRNAEVWVPAS